MTLPRLNMDKSNWDGNGWPSIDFGPFDYDYADLLVVLSLICDSFSIDFPYIVDTLDGYTTDLDINGERVSLLLDNWTFSLATSNPVLRDEIFLALQSLLH